MSAFSSVAPSLFASTALLEAGTAAAKDAVTSAFNGFHIRQHIMDARQAIRAGVPGIGEAEVAASTLVLVYEISLDSKEEAAVQTNGEVYVTRHSAGLRVVVKVSNIKASFKLNLFTVAVASSFGLASSHTEIFFKGLPSDAGAFGDAPGVDVLQKKEGLETLLQYIRRVKNYIADHPDAIFPEKNTVVMGRRASNPVSAAQSVVFAMHRIVEGLPLRDVLEQNVETGFDPDLIRAVYQAVLEAYDEDTRPGSVHREKARNWLNV